MTPHFDPRLTWLALSLALVFGSVLTWAALGKSWRLTATLLGTLLVWTVSTAAIVQSGASADLWTIDPLSNAGRYSRYDQDADYSSQVSTYVFAAKITGSAGTYPFAMCGVAHKKITIRRIEFDQTVNTAALHSFNSVWKTNRQPTANVANGLTIGTITLMDNPNPNNKQSAVTYLATNFLTSLSAGAINTSGIVGTLDAEMRWAQLGATVTSGSAITRTLLMRGGPEVSGLVLNDSNECFELHTDNSNTYTSYLSVQWTERNVVLENVKQE